MPAGARLFPASPKPSGGPVVPPLRSPRVKVARAAKDARFQKVIGQLQQRARKAATHPPAARKAAEAQAAAKAPPNEKEAGARANQVDQMKDAKTEKPNKGGFLAVLRAEIEKVMPKNLDQADKFMEGGESQQMKGAVGGNVSQQKQQAAGPTETATKAPPDTGKVEGKDVTPLPADPAAPAAPVAGADAMPAPAPAADVQKPATEAAASADQKLKDAELTDKQLKKANDPRFSGALGARDKAKATAAAGPAKYRASETNALNRAKAGATADSGKGAAALAATKTATSGKTKTRQQVAKEKDEAARKKVADDIAAIFDKTKSKVEEKLSTLETDVMAIFDAGADAALANMKDSANTEIEKYKSERYSGFIGKGRWLKDLFSDTPPEIKNIIARARTRFTAEMDALAVRVAALVDRRLAEAKAIVAAGQAEVKRYVASLAPNLRSAGRAAEQEMAAKFDELKNSVDEKANDLAEKLAQKYKDASEKADSAAKEMEEANKGALKGLADKIGEIVKMLAEFADRVVALFKKAAGVVKEIIADPIGFLGNLLAAIKQGIGKFVSNIWTHIKKGFMTWLFGELTKAGVEIPSDLTLPSILKLVLGVLGLTWTNIRPKIVKKIGEGAVTVLEKVVEMLAKLFTSGPEALWEEMKAFVGDLKGMVIDAIIDWVINKVITSAITKVASMFNPAGAIIQAIIMVYNVGAWLVANIGRILDFVESVVNSVDRIVKGDVGGAATFVEMALARMVPILIGFLASLLGLGGLSAKIKSFIEKVQAKVSKAVDVVIDKVFNLIKKLFGKGGAKDKDKDKDDGKAVDWNAVKQKFKDDDQHDHTVYVAVAGGTPTLTVASAPKAAMEFIVWFVGEKGDTWAKNEKNKPKIKTAKSAATAAEKVVTKIAQAKKAKKGEAAIKKLQKDLLEKNVALGEAVSKLVGDSSLCDVEKYKLEGLTGTYGSMPKPSGDDLTADHQPQAAVLQACAKFDYFDDKGELVERAAGRAKAGFAINLYKVRHAAGRTFGSKGKGTKESFLKRVKPLVKKKPPAEQRKIAVKELKAELKEDVDEMKAVANKDAAHKYWLDVMGKKPKPASKKQNEKLVKEIRARILAGEDQLAAQDMNSLVK
ncbi:MAG TPA: hypothetical protein VGK73_38085 [Polyangiaceae bacterium]